MTNASPERALARLTTVPRQKIEELLAQLQPRERRMVLAAAAVTALLLLWLAVVDPIVGGLARLEREATQARSDAEAVAGLLLRHESIQKQVSALERDRQQSEATSLFSQLESLTIPAVGRDHVAAMNPSSRPVGDNLTEETVEMRLDAVTMRDLTSLLHAIELGGRPIRLTRLAFKRQYKSPSQLDVTLVVARLRSR